MKIFVINGPNINMLGIREKDIYGATDYEGLVKLINDWADSLDIDVECYQSNVEGEIVNFIQKAYFDHADGIVINPAAYTHTSIAILDALKATNIPTIEIHISDVDAREDFRKRSYIREYVIKTIKGEGIEGYHHALKEMKNYLEGK